MCRLQVKRGEEAREEQKKAQTGSVTASELVSAQLLTQCTPSVKKPEQDVDYSSIKVRPFPDLSLEVPPPETPRKPDVPTPRRSQGGEDR